MQEQHLFEYAVIRVVPRVEREEFFNAGVILYCKTRQFLQVRIFLDEKKLLAFCPEPDLDIFRTHLFSFQQICEAKAGAGPIAQLDLAGRFRWLAATRSTILQSSRVHPGLCTDPAETLDRLFQQLVR
jgi:hypothetical protein